MKKLSKLKTKPKIRITDSSGFTLVELLIGAGIIVLGLSVITALIHQNLRQNTIDVQRDKFNQIASLVRGFVNDDVRCTTFFNLLGFLHVLRDRNVHGIPPNMPNFKFDNNPPTNPYLQELDVVSRFSYPPPIPPGPASPPMPNLTPVVKVGQKYGNKGPWIRELKFTEGFRGPSGGYTISFPPAMNAHCPMFPPYLAYPDSYLTDPRKCKVYISNLRLVGYTNVSTAAEANALNPVSGDPSKGRFVMIEDIPIAISVTNSGYLNGCGEYYHGNLSPNQCQQLGRGHYSPNLHVANCY